MSQDMNPDKSHAFINARLIDPKQGLDEQGTLVIENGKVAAIGRKAKPPPKAEQIDASGLVLLPGRVDMQVFIGEPGTEYRETLATASQAAAAGGVTSLIVMPNTDPVIDDAALVDFISRRARDTALVRVHPMAAITKGTKGRQLTEFALLQEAGAVAFTDGNRSVMNAQTMCRALSYATNFNALIMHHASDRNLVGAGVMNSGALAMRLGLAGIPIAAETIMIERDIRLVALTGARLHIAQISSAESVDIIRAAKKRGLQVTCGVSATHLMLNERDVANYRTFAKLDPPLRTEEDRLALVAGVADGTIDVIVSAHNPQDEDAKRRPFTQAEYGSIGIETLLASALTLYHDKQIELMQLIASITTKPAQLLGLSAGHLAVGAAADFCLLDLDKPFVVDSDALHSKSKNAAIEGRKLQGRLVYTAVGGKTVFNESNHS